MQVAGRGRQWGQHKPGTTAGISSWEQTQFGFTDWVSDGLQWETSVCTVKMSSEGPASVNADEKCQVFNVSTNWRVRLVAHCGNISEILWWKYRERVCLLYWLLHRWGEGSVHCDSVRLRIHTYTWCTHPPPTVHYCDKLFPGANMTPLSL